MGLIKYFRISEPSPRLSGDYDSTYKKLRSKTFRGVTVSYSLYYVCRMVLSVVKQPLIDQGVFTPGQLGIIGGGFLYVYALGKLINGFIADYCNIRRFMFAGILLSAIINLLLGLSGSYFFIFLTLWSINGWAQSMGAPPGTISLSRWMPAKSRGVYYSIFSSSPYIGKFISFIITGFIVGHLGWQLGFTFSSIAGFIGAFIAISMISDTPESNGLPSIQELTGEKVKEKDTASVRTLHKYVLRKKAIWIIALSSALIYITQYGVTNWGVLFLQKSKSFRLEQATQIIAFSEIFGIAGTVAAGWLSDKVFKGNRTRPVLIAGIVSIISLCLFLFTKGNSIVNTIYISLFSLAFGVIFCIVAGIMALDIIPRKATGAALGIVGISSYIAAGTQDVVSGYLIQNYVHEAAYNFTPVSIFWISACVLSVLIPLLNWKYINKKNA